MSKISRIEDLRKIYKPVSGRSAQKVINHLDIHCRRFIAKSPFLIMGTQAPAGSDDTSLGDVTPRGEDPGFVQVPDDRTLLMPDRPGNNRLDSYENILRNPAVSLIFLIPGVNETLRVNGDAEIRDDESLCKQFEVCGKQPVTVLRVSVQEVYLHCARSLMRSRLWAPESKIDRKALPTMGQMISDQIGSAGPVESQTEMEARYEKVLY